MRATCPAHLILLDLITLELQQTYYAHLTAIGYARTGAAFAFPVDVLLKWNK
jgi:hypothetical protein